MKKLLLFVAVLMSSLAAEESVLESFAKHPVWGEPAKKAPVPIGFSVSDFQLNGPEIHPNTNWGEHYRKHFAPFKHLPDMWNHPERVIDRLVDLGVKKFRFSISRDKVEEGHLQHYLDLCLKLQEHQIEPMVTLQHLTDLSGFNWEEASHIDGFVDFAVKAAEVLYAVGVRKIMTINEPTVMAFQGWVMGDFPPYLSWDFEGAGRVIENMMNAHTQVYRALKERYPDLEIGLAHDPIRFRYYHKYNPLFSPGERMLCYYLTELNHAALMRYFQTGIFSMATPLLGNYSFKHPTPPPLDFIGIQYYTDPLIKFPEKTSVTRVEGEKTTTYGYRTYPQGLASILQEMRSLGIPIDITEIGIDLGINHDENDLERIQYFDRIFQVVNLALQEGVNVRSLYFWTLIDNLEFHKGFDIRFGFYSFDPETGEIAPRPVQAWLRRMIAVEPN